MTTTLHLPDFLNGSHPIHIHYNTTTQNTIDKIYVDGVCAPFHLNQNKIAEFIRQSATVFQSSKVYFC